MVNLSGLVTESRNESSAQIDRLPTLEMLRVINEQDKLVALAVEKELPRIAQAVEAVYERVSAGGRMVYAGAGTSGRLGVLDASECPPTYGVPETMVTALIAGGRQAMFCAKEGAEDDPALCGRDLREIGFSKADVLVGIAASGRTPYVLGGLRYARGLGAYTVSITCNPASEAAGESDCAIAPVVGPEVVTGSTRMKAGTAQKLVLNMLSTGLMIRMGKVYGNLMVDVRPTNEKLAERAVNIVMEAAGTGRAAAKAMLERTDYRVKTAITALLAGIEPGEADRRLERHGGRIARAIAERAGGDADGLSD